MDAYSRTRTLSGQLWFEEAIATGIAQHSLGALSGVLRNAGSAPLYYVVLHIWIDLFGAGQTTTHLLSLLIGLLTIPIAMWAGWSMAGRRSRPAFGVVRLSRWRPNRRLRPKSPD